jgi:release factor glutamine methyltransferase
MDLRTALLQGRKLLEDAQVTAPRLTAEVLLAHAVGCDRSWLYAHSNDLLKEVWWIHYGRYLHQRIGGIPTQYITGRQEFYGREFRVTKDVLIPRPETEHLIEAAIPKAHGMVADIGTGSGVIAVTLALETSARVVATDISIPALAVAAGNARKLGAAVSFVACDLGAGLASHSFDIVVSNPPYVPEGGIDQREVRDHEPSLALYGGADGLAVYRRLIPEAARLLKPGGWLFLELGYQSLDGVRPALEGWRDLEVTNDLAGWPRVIAARS